MAFILGGDRINGPIKTGVKQVVTQERPVVIRDVISKPTIKQSAVMTDKQKEARRMDALNARLGTVRTQPEYSIGKKIEDIARNPLTAAGYVARNESIPNNFASGPRNALDRAVDVINPFFYTNKAVEAVKNTGSAIRNASKGKYREAGNDITEAAFNAADAMVGAKISMNAFSAGNRIVKAKNAVEFVASAGSIPSKEGKKIVGTLYEDYAAKNADVDLYDNTIRNLEKAERGIGNKIAKVSEKSKGAFEKQYGATYTDKDLGLFSRLQQTEVGKRDPMVSHMIKANRVETSLLDAEGLQMRKELEIKPFKEFEKKHGVTKDYSKTDELLNNVYTRGYDSSINNRGYDTDINQKFYKETIAPKLETLVKKNKLKSEETFFRGEHDYPIKDVWREGKKLKSNSVNLSELQQNDIWRPNAFVSTSQSKFMAGGFGPIASEIKAPAGQSFLPSNSVKGGGYATEKEMLLPSKLKFKIEERVGTGENTKFKQSIVNPYTVTGLVAGGSLMFQNNK